MKQQAASRCRGLIHACSSAAASACHACAEVMGYVGSHLQVVLHELFWKHLTGATYRHTSSDMNASQCRKQIPLLRTGGLSESTTCVSCCLQAISCKLWHTRNVLQMSKQQWCETAAKHRLAGFSNLPCCVQVVSANACKLLPSAFCRYPGSHDDKVTASHWLSNFTC